MLGTEFKINTRTAVRHGSSGEQSMNEFYCDTCREQWTGAYNSDGRCVTCGSSVRLELGDTDAETGEKREQEEP